MINYYLGSNLIKRIVENRNFKEEIFTDNKVPGLEYEECKFISCTFGKINLSGSVFVDCEFRDCDLSNVTVANASFKNVLFVNCKLLGLNFNECSKFLLSFKFEYCQLDYSSFHQLKIKNIKFIKCSLKEVDFSECNLKEAIFANCNLSGALFENTNLEKTNFLTSFNYSLDPENNYTRKAKFSKEGIIGLLTKHDIIIE